MGVTFMLLHFFFCRVAMLLIRKRESTVLSCCPLLIGVPARPRLSQQISLQPHICECQGQWQSSDRALSLAVFFSPVLTPGVI